MSHPRQNGSQNEDLQSLSVRGWQNSKAANNDDGGVQSLRVFLQKKALRNISNVNVQGDALIITVKSSDAHRFLHLNNFTWAGTTISVKPVGSAPRTNQIQPGQPPSGPRHQNNQQRFNAPSGPQQNNRFNQQGHQQRNDDNVIMGSAPAPTPANNASEVETTMISVIRKRYNAPQKYLTLEALALDPDFQAAGLSSQSASKVFAALFVTCEKSVFETPAKRREMVESLSLSNNSLTTVKDVIAAASTFSNIKNLDLSQNNIADIGELKYWRNRFRNLEHLILTGNPIDSKPETRDTMRRWYPKLKLYNNQPVTAASTVTQNNPLQAAPNPGLQALAQPAALQTPTPPLSTSPVYTLPTETHPEFPPGSTFGVQTPDKPQDQLLKEQMGLKFSYETRLKMHWVEQCLTANNFNYDAAIADLQTALNAGGVPADAFLQV